MSSPQDPKRNIPTKGEENEKVENETRHPSPPKIVEAPPDNAPAVSDAKNNATATTAPTTTAPLAPPPRPTQNNTSDTPDYFSGAHGSNHFNLEPNPFEQSFGNSSVETPGKSLLPPVASLTSPSSLLPAGTPGWSQSLRSGPLSPAMLTGPAGGSDYFGEPWKGGFPTPNESSLRTGLTPGGGGSMFPAPSPNSQALFSQLQSGGATPSTSEFYRAAFKMNNFGQNVNGPTSQPPEPSTQAGDNKSFPAPQQPQPATQGPQQDPFGQHDANVVTSLLGLSRADAAQNSNNQFAIPGQPPHGINTNLAHVQAHMGGRSQDTSPTSLKRAGKNSIASMSGSADGGEFSEDAHSEDAKPSRSRNKKAANGKGTSINGRRKADDGAVKGPSNKKAKGNNGNAMMDDDDDSDDEHKDHSVKQEGSDGKKMTDEEKRKNFLERNRVAALKCRQRKKQWLANLQAKVELFSTENDALSAQITQLREEIVNLKTMLLAHKDCPVSQAQGISGMAMTNFIGDINHHAHPYGMGMPPNGVPPMGMGMPQPPQQSMQRR
ncbi:uncharacterized protein K452DRAFT_88428 [Aplosporella prunicola CBS 121167]|uniref:BZIP domain-containing protein n=1 Tax=Aplosporella prunicola CBS 121167 TaxID=1176127 RepID=A0A6A6B3C9_9PEZI|nr:uncharacterized protein K452DRAFT_88428 [Aplosporella prunicola CBS 121167]KAF2138560.1 hypothetical protein K452DRAFT_88428 [Aplosporella prunicola CBS 121167]